MHGAKERLGTHIGCHQPRLTADGGPFQAERIGPHVDTEQYGICIVSRTQTARPPGSTAPRARTHETYTRMLLAPRRRWFSASNASDLYCTGDVARARAGEAATPVPLRRTAVQRAKASTAVPRVMSRNTKAFWNALRSAIEMPT
jgi:hypothetical protein